jgi:hypothetical protein
MDVEELLKEYTDNLLKRFDTLKTERSTYDAHWQEIAEVLSPAGAIFIDSPATAQPQNRNFRRVYDTTGIHANELLSSGFFSLLTSPSVPWFELRTNNWNLDQTYEMQVWLNIVTKIMMFEIQRPHTGFATAMHEFYLELGAYGNGIMFVTEKSDFSGLLFQALPLVECYFMENDEGFIDTLVRYYARSALQLAERYGVNNLPENVQQELTNPSTSKKFEILHFILPNSLVNVISPFPVEMPYLSLYIEKASRQILSMAGFEEQPFMASRFQKMPQEIYGRGPGSSALADIDLLQEMTKTLLRGAQKIVDPPLQMPDQGFVTPPTTAPGRMNYYRSGSQDRIEPIQTGGRPDIGMDIIMPVQNRIREIFFVDQLQLNIGPQMTATEVLQRTEEKQRLMGPVTGRVATELLAPLIIRSFGLLARSGKLPDPPPAFFEAGATLRIVYTSPIFKSQEQVAANNLTRATQVLLPFVSADPTIMDVFHAQRIARGVGEVFNIDPTYFCTEEEFAAKQQQRSEAAQQAQEAERMKNMGIGINNMASAGQTLQESGVTLPGM